MNVLVTGAAGFIGSHLVERLLCDGGWKITVIDDLNDFYSPEIKRANLETVRRSGQIDFHKADIRDAAALRAVFERNEFHAIVHLAAIPAPGTPASGFALGPVSSAGSAGGSSRGGCGTGAPRPSTR